jgi:hypothetical protein
MRKILRFSLFFFGLLTLVLAITIAPIDRYAVKDQSFYQDMLASIRPIPTAIDTGSWRAGAAKVSLTPRQRTATAGYGKRRGKPFTHIDDSIFVRTLVLATGAKPVAIVAADLLIIPPLVRAELAERLPEIGFTIDQVYLGATHSHNSLGNWSKGVSAFLYGSYSDSIKHFITNQIIESIRLAVADVQAASLSYQSVHVPEAVSNRLNKGGPVDSILHVLRIDRQDQKKFVLTTFAAHATCFPADSITLSRDYPGRLVDLLEQSGFDHAQFLAAAVGSQTTHVPDDAASCVAWTAETLAAAFRRDSATSISLRASLGLQQIPLLMPASQAKISKDWRLRPWVFQALMGETANMLTVLKLGSLVMIGTPCDFSGELALPLYRHAVQKNMQVMVTSFNGGYMGYITPDVYYDQDHYETRLMNWYGPGNGTYFLDCMRRIVDVNAQ